MNPADALTISENIAVLFHLEQERSAFLRLVAAIDSLDEEHAPLAIELDFSVHQLWSGNLNWTASGLFRDHIDRFLRERLPEQ